MEFRVKTIMLAVAAVSLAALVGFTAQQSESREVAGDKSGIERMLNDFNQAATDADFDAYFACLAPEAIVIGTDATERWTVDEFKSFVRPYFRGQGSRIHTPKERHISFCADGNVAYFDEIVAIETLGDCRGTGVVVKLDDEWLITQYCLSFPVPNEVVWDVVDRIRDHRYGLETPPARDDSGVRESLNAYLSAASYPDLKPIDPALLAVDVEMLWSDGNTYRGRHSVVQAIEKSQRELKASMESLEAKAEQVHVEMRGDVAWVSCLIELEGKVLEGGEPFARTVRATFVFERDGDRWQIVSEHSNRIVEDS